MRDDDVKEDDDVDGREKEEDREEERRRVMARGKHLEEAGLGRGLSCQVLVCPFLLCMV